MVARCHGGDKVAERDRLAKTKLRWRRREHEENRARVLIFLNVGSTSVFNKKKKKTDVNQMMLTLTLVFWKKLMLTYHTLTSVFQKTDVKVYTLFTIMPPRLC